jgi:hypothetical protein
MNTKLLLCLALVLSGLVTGCETESIHSSRIALTNLNGDGLTKTNGSVSMECYGGLKNGKTSVAFSLDSRCWLVLFYPTNKLNQVLETQTESKQVYAWLVQTQFDCEMLRSVKTPSAPAFPNSELLHGKVQVAQYDWRHKNLFHVGVDLAGGDVALKCEFNSYDKSKFDAKQLWLDPYLIIFGPFVKW